MTSAPGPYGAHPPATPHPVRYRPSAGWFVAGIALVLMAIAAGIAIVVWLLAGFLDTDATIRANGEPQQVRVGTDGDRMLWLDDASTTCRIVDTATGDEIPIRTVTGSFVRSDPDGDLEGLYRFSPGSGSLEVTCATRGPAGADGSEDAGLVLIGPMPEIDSFVLGVLLAIAVPGVLGLTGLVVLIWTGILWSLREPRPQGR